MFTVKGRPVQTWTGCYKTINHSLDSHLLPLYPLPLFPKIQTLQTLRFPFFQRKLRLEVA